MKTNEAGLKIIAEAEGLRLRAYKPTPADVWTLGRGHTRGVVEGQECTEKEADDWLVEDVAWAEGLVEETVKVPLNENEFSALVSLAFNLKTPVWRKCGLLKVLNGGDYTGAALKFREYCRQKRPDGTSFVLPGLVKRRAAEALLFTRMVERVEK